MELNILKPRKALNKAFLKVKANRHDIELFKTNLIGLLGNINESESEEFHKNLVSKFLTDTYYGATHFINTKGRNDLVIHNTNTAAGTVGVIIEAKKPTNKSEMMRTDNINAKAFQELVLYYLRERITAKNLEIKYLVATNIYEWFIFDANFFEKEFAQNKNLVKQFTDFEEGRLSGKTTDFFYKQIAEPVIEAIKHEVIVTHFDIRDYDKPLRNADKKDDNTLIALYKLLSPEHLLKLPFANDSNSLDKVFYTELLHIIGLTETKEGSKKLIQRKKEGERNAGSLIENTIVQLDIHDKITRIKKVSQYGETYQEQLFNVALELVITWLNRILFLKLLEAQLLSYHKKDKQYLFLNIDKIRDFDDLDKLFFRVLAKKVSEREASINELFSRVPYLNSSLFEPTELEHQTIFISGLEDFVKLPLISATVIKDGNGKKQTDALTTIQYIFEFLNAYDFASEGREEIQEDNKRLINASVLGLIFEKINGYKDGSFFTPGFITMYMCRETIRRAVVQKFNEVKNWNCADINDLYNKIDDRAEANTIINSLKICDPAVGSGHFLVSALNEIIAIKSDLKILTDRSGKRLKEYVVEVENDELIVTDDDGELFDYNPQSPESQRIQETLFHEKQTLIENCLFGVDINPNSVKICRLRLWIELLKNAYYKSSPPFQGGVPEGGGGFKTNYGVPEGGSGHSLHNLPYLKTFRKALRNNLTAAEATLWTMLKGKALEGRKFRRQHSVANYILDFYCPDEQLAIELDGQGHNEVSQAEYDMERDLFLKHTGIKVLRFENSWVWENPDGILQAIRNEFGKQKPPRPSDTPPFKGGELRELETLPNIDINIKCGNSLISRYALDADIKKALKRSKWSIDSYRLAVHTYRNAQSKEEKRAMERLISEIKNDFESEIAANDKRLLKLNKAKGELYALTTQTTLFERTKTEKATWDKQVKSLADTITALETEMEEIRSNRIYENAFEWRFEFPEVLNDEGDFVGFDVVIGNPPYIPLESFGATERNLFRQKYIQFERKFETSVLFMVQGFDILTHKGILAYIAPATWQTGENYQKFRRYILTNKGIDIIINLPFNTFEDAFVDTSIYLMPNNQRQQYKIFNFDKKDKTSDLSNLNFDKIENSSIKEPDLKLILYKNVGDLVSKYSNENFISFGEITKSTQGLSGSNFLKTDKMENDFAVFPFLSKGNVYNYALVKESSYLTDLSDKKSLIQFYEAEPKILIRRIINRQDRLSVGYCSEKLVFKKDINPFICINDSYSIKYLLGILSSKYISYLYLKMSSIATKDDFRQTTLSELRKLPIPKIDLIKQQQIILNVDNILTLKQTDYTIDTTALESEIDQLVYQLYGLTADEIKIVEGS